MLNHDHTFNWNNIKILDTELQQETHFTDIADTDIKEQEWN